MGSKDNHLAKSLSGKLFNQPLAYQSAIHSYINNSSTSYSTTNTPPTRALSPGRNCKLITNYIMVN
eukprot:c36466_g1_i1 orf=86-283(+)